MCLLWNKRSGGKHKETLLSCNLDNYLKTLTVQFGYDLKQYALLNANISYSISVSVVATLVQSAF